MDSEPTQSGGSGPIEVLNLVGKADSPCYRQQVEGLDGLGVDTTTLSVAADAGVGDRSIRDYLRLHVDTIAAARGDYDLVHANYGLTAPAAITQRRLPVVLSLWGSDLMGEYGWLSRWCARRCDEVVVMSDEMAAELDVPCHVIPHGIDLDLFAPRETADAKAAVGWDADATHVLFPYSPEREVKDYPRAERVVESVDARVSESVVLQYVTGVDHDEMPLYMNAADALLLTSKREGSPNVVKEAMACNTPVVSTAVGDVREQLAGVEPSAVGESDAALVEHLRTVLRSDRRSNGRESVRHLDRARLAQRLRSVYESALDASGRADARKTPLAASESRPAER
jgi:glycosyltransferase involved in cell wall biosynthesis